MNNLFLRAFIHQSPLHMSLELFGAALLFCVALSVLVFLLIRFFQVWLPAFRYGTTAIALDRTNYSPGQIIQGKIVADLKRPLAAERLDVNLIAESVWYTRGGGRHGGASIRHTKHLYMQTKTLGKDASYFKEEFPFEVTVPPLTALESSEGTIVWFLSSGLYLSGGKPLVSKQLIQVL